MLVQHTGDVPETLPVTAEAADRLREQANQLGAPTVVRLIDLLAVAIEDMRQGGDPRLPLELALVKVTRPAADLSREGMAFRLDRLEQGGVQAAPVRVPQGSDPVGSDPVTDVKATPKEAPSLELAQLQEAWRRSVLPAVEERSIPAGAILAEANAALEADTLTLEFPPKAEFHRRQAEDQKNASSCARRSSR